MTDFVEDGIRANNHAMSIEQRQLLEKYEVGKLVGCGAFAKVYHARVVDTGESVAIKAINKHRIHKASIKREISIMRRLRHPHIVSLHEVLATKSKVYFVMDFAKGGELFAKVAKGRFSEDLSRKYFQQLISAVDFCHSHGVFHRDLKPENLLLDDNWDLKVTDFGLSAVDTDQTRQDGLLHTLCGTPAYVAPEILAKKGYDGSKVDVWSCGIILYVLNSGYLPFNDTNLMAMYRKIYKGQFRCPKWISSDLRRFLSRLLDPNPKTRITVHEILNDPWFKKGYNLCREPEFKLEAEEAPGPSPSPSPRYLNAFDLICYSSGADLSGLFNYDMNSEMFVSDESPEAIMRRLEVGAEEEGMRVSKKGMGLKLHGHNWKYVIMVEINRLTEQLVVVEVKWSGFGHDLWVEKFKPRLHDLVYVPHQQEQVPGHN